MNGTLKIILLVVAGILAFSFVMKIGGMVVNLAIFALVGYVIFRVATHFMAKKK